MIKAEVVEQFVKSPVDVKTEFFDTINSENLMDILWELAFCENLTDEEVEILMEVWSETCFRCGG